MTDKTTVASYTTSATITVLGGLTINEWMALIGIILGIATFAVNWFYKYKHYKLAEKNRKGGK